MNLGGILGVFNAALVSLDQRLFREEGNGKRDIDKIHPRRLETKDTNLEGIIICICVQRMDITRLR